MNNDCAKVNEDSKYLGQHINGKPADHSGIRRHSEDDDRIGLDEAIEEMMEKRVGVQAAQNWVRYNRVAHLSVRSLYPTEIL